MVVSVERVSQFERTFVSIQNDLNALGNVGTVDRVSKQMITVPISYALFSMASPHIPEGMSNYSSNRWLDNNTFSSQQLL